MIIWQRATERVKAFLDSTIVLSVLTGAITVAIIFASLSISVWVTEDPQDASRGGAIVVAMSFYFILRNVRVVDPKLSNDGKVHIEAQIEKENRILLSIMSIGGTLAWGFLDIVAEFMLCEVIVT